MKALTTFIAIALLAFSTTACSQQHTYRSGGFGSKTVKASKNYVTKDIKVDNFTKLSVAGSPDVTYTQKSGKPTVEVYTSDNIVDLLDIRVKDNTLYIGFKKNVSVSYNKLEVRVSAEKLNGIAVAGSGDVELKNGLKTDDIKISVAGSGDISGNNISCTDLDISIAGSGDMKLNNVTANFTRASVAGSGTAILSGSTQEAEYSVAGSGDLLASDFVAKKASASVAGSGDIKCHATDFLKVRTSGSGSVGYKGNPELDYPKKGLYKL